MSSLYLHIPFCLKKCLYCAFASQIATVKDQELYLLALKKELESIREKATPLKTIFIGGGTPTSLEAASLSGLIKFVKDHFEVVDDAEISVEANPGTVSKRYFDILLAAGVNRLSLGVQTFDDGELSRLGRLHNSSEAIQAVKEAQEAGFTNINLDLMYGLPGQSPLSWAKSLDMALSLVPQHLSLYQLMVEEGTPFALMDENDNLPLPSEDDVLQMDTLTRERTVSHNFIQYETSNYCLPGFECSHNINYWENDDYLAAGAASVSFLGGVREKRISDHKEYVKKVGAGKSPVIESECLSREESFRETVIMGLRMVRGVNLEKIRNRYHLDPQEYYGSTLTSLVESGMVELTPTHLRLTQKGAPLSNTVMAELV